MSIQPIKRGHIGPEVSDLHKGLLSLLAHQPGISDNDRETLRKRLMRDVNDHKFGKATADIVGIYQYLLKHWPNDFPQIPPKLKPVVQSIQETRAGTGNGEVDDATAEALNWLVGTFRKLPKLTTKQVKILLGTK